MPSEAHALALVSCPPASACNRANNDQSATPSAASASEIDLAALDKSVKPGDDFFSFVNGTWVKNTEIPADRSSIGGFFIADFFIADQERERSLRRQYRTTNPTFRRRKQ
jgi:hypothetical protein